MVLGVLIAAAVFLPDVPKPAISGGALGALEAHVEPGSAWGNGDEGQALAERIFTLLTDELEFEAAHTGVAVTIVRSEPRQVVAIVHVDDRDPLSAWPDADKTHLLAFLRMVRTWGLPKSDVFSVGVHDGSAYYIVGTEAADGTWRADTSASPDLGPVEEALEKPERADDSVPLKSSQRGASSAPS